MLKNIRKIASNVYRLPRPAAANEDAGLQGPLIEVDAVEDAVATSRPARFQTPLLNGPQSVKAFFDEMMEYAAGNDIRMDHIEHSYKQLAIEKRWTPVSMKALSMHLVAFGCKRKRIGAEKKTVLAFPLAKETQPK